jgi:nucleotide-binding universal stress UspA family protein
VPHVMVENKKPVPTGHQRRTIVVGVDGSEYAHCAVKWAADEAKARGAVLQIVFAGTKEPTDGPASPSASSLISSGEAIVGDAFGLVALRHPSVVIESEVVPSGAAEALVAASLTADLLVLGARGKGGFKELLLGSVGERCIHRAHCPVVIVRSGTADPVDYSVHGRIVVGVDGSDSSGQALRWALEEGAIRGASVEAVSAYQFAPLTGTTNGTEKGYQSAAILFTKAASVEAEKLQPNVSFRADTRFGDAVPSLLSACEGADLLVLGSRGHGMVHDALLGSVAHQCAHHAPCPVVIMRDEL